MGRSKMAWSSNVRLFLKLTSQRCQLLSVGSKSETSGGQKPGIFESDILASASNARHVECLFAKWIKNKSSIRGHFFQELVKEEVDTPKLFHPSPKDPNISGVFFSACDELKYLPTGTEGSVEHFGIGLEYLCGSSSKSGHGGPFTFNGNQDIWHLRPYESWQKTSRLCFNDKRSGRSVFQKHD
ncbi:uncharacterized protein LOC108028574 isoform X2 [Drosophila biarmipes]|uniref:uncharacterized protein LOC108028574 isoform X2 n=1 Tax=Drosophila biarmipes TaxID=125945 RepID=UPI0021CCCB6D|nr:uncharacterized protein LOC108028574 isoform X2 [Drosophila biarmipes]